MATAARLCNVALLLGLASNPASADDPPSPENAAKLERAKQLDARVGELFRAAQYSEAVPLAKESLKLREEALGLEHPDVARSLNNLAVLLKSQGQYDAARPLCERALEIRERALGPDHPAVATGLNNLAEILKSQTEYDAARPMYERALRIWEKVHGPEHPLVATSLHNLAVLLYLQGQYDAARPLRERELRIQEKAHGPEHPNVAESLNHLAMLLESQGDCDAAQPLCERALKLRERAFGPDHPDVAESLTNLAVLLCSQGQYGAARPLHERALRIQEKALGPDHPAVSANLNNLAELLKAQGQYDAAQPLFERALRIREERHGPNHPDVAVSLNNLALLLQSRGQYDAARPLHERALTIFEAVHGRQHPDIALSLNNLALLLCSQGQYDAARPRCEMALRIREKTLGPGHPDVASSLNNLGALLEAQGQYDAARPLHERALKIREEALGPEHPRVALGLHNLAASLDFQGQHDAAGPLHERALRITEGGLRRGLAGLQGAERLRSMERSRAYLDSWLRAAPKCGRTGYEEVLRIRGLVTRAEAAERALLRAGGDAARARREDILALDRQLGGLSAKFPRELEKREAWRNRCAEIAAKREELLLALAKDYAPMREAEERLDLALADIRKAISRGEALLDFLRVGDIYVAFVVLNEGDVIRVDLSKGIDEAAEAFVSAVARGDAEGASGDRLAALVFAPVREKLPAGLKRIYVCPDAALAAVPFAALPGSRTGTALLDEFEIVHLEMAQDLVPVAAPKPGAGALAVGGVDYGKSEFLPSSAPPPLLVMVDRAPGDGKRWEPLPGTAREAELLHKRIPGDLLSGATATEGRFRELCRGKEVLHLATHGYVRTDRLARTLELRGEASRFDAGMERQVAVGTDPMLLAGVAFAGADTGDGGEGDDGLLTAAEASWLNLDGVRLAVLSACETGRGTLAAGEGTLGLVRGFRLAGARTVVASLWKVDDAATALLMEKFYEGFLGRKLSPAAALREAALAARAHEDKDGRRPFAAPRYWAAFVAYGP